MSHTAQARALLSVADEQLQLVLLVQELRRRAEHRLGRQSQERALQSVAGEQPQLVPLGQELTGSDHVRT